MTTMAAQRGDDLEDDFVPDDLVALSDEDSDLPNADDIAGLLSADEDGDNGAQASHLPSEAAMEKKRKRRAKEKERKAKVRSFGLSVTRTLLTVYARWSEAEISRDS